MFPISEIDLTLRNSYQTVIAVRWNKRWVLGHKKV